MQRPNSISTTLRAPFDGVTGIRRIDIGNIVSPTDTNGIVVLTQVQPISVLFTLPTSDIAAVQAALTRGPVAATAYDQSGARERSIPARCCSSTTRPTPDPGRCSSKRSFLTPSASSGPAASSTPR